MTRMPIIRSVAQHRSISEGLLGVELNHQMLGDRQIDIEVDGGVDAVTCQVCKQAGAEVLVAGSAYFKAADRAAFVKKIQE